MTITFQNVGRGDSILLEWSDGDKSKIAIVDCNIFNRSNPTLTFLRSQQIKEVEFILLTHPHADHFRGMREVIEFCGNNNILIKYFIHTANSIPEYLRAAVKGPMDTKELALLFQTIDKACVDGKITHVTTITVNWEYRINDDWKMAFFAPSYNELRKFNNDLYSKKPEVQSRVYQTANYLATLVMFFKKDEYFLLSSDVESSVFKRELSKNIQTYKKKNLLLAQIPHHGAEVNFYQKFWKNLKYNFLTPLVASVGTNDPKHPCPQVLLDLLAMNYAVKLTSSLDPYKVCSSSSLDLISTTVTETEDPIIYTF